MDDFTAFEIGKTLPNFVTVKTITAELLLLTKDDSKMLDGKIVVIEVMILVLIGSLVMTLLVLLHAMAARTLIWQSDAQN